MKRIEHEIWLNGKSGLFEPCEVRAHVREVFRHENVWGIFRSEKANGGRKTGALRDSDVRRLHTSIVKVVRAGMSDTCPLVPRQDIGCHTSDLTYERGIIAGLLHKSNFLKCLSRHAGKLACTVLRRLGAGNSPRLSGTVYRKYILQEHTTI